MATHDLLEAFIRKTLQDLGVTIEQELTDDTSLLRSGLFDSMGLLNLVAWVEGQVGVPMDPMALDPLTQWDTMRDILTYCAEQSRAPLGAGR